VLVPLAMPRIFNSLRLLFGLAFGYIMLSETIVEPGEAGGIGSVINMAQRRGHPETIIFILIVIPAVALVIDRVVFFVQRSLFPYQYGGAGLLHALRSLEHGPWWPPLDELIDGARRFYAGGLTETQPAPA